MSESLAVLRRRRTDELARLADEHEKHDLLPEDREILKKAASRTQLWTAIGSGIGMGIGLSMAFRLRTARRAFFQAFRAAEKPTRVVFADGRTGMPCYLRNSMGFHYVANCDCIQSLFPISHR